jgi:hypothetical protein
MGKRSDFERISRDFYRTPTEAVLPLRPFFGGGFCLTLIGFTQSSRLIIYLACERL